MARKTMQKITIELKGTVIHSKYFRNRYKAYRCLDYLKHRCPPLENAFIDIETIPFDASQSTEDLLW